MRGAYSDDENGREEMMLDIEDSVIVIAGLVPWCIACAVPLGMLGCSASSLPYAMYLYIIPVFHYIMRKMQKRKGSNV